MCHFTCRSAGQSVDSLHRKNKTISVKIESEDCIHEQFKIRNHSDPHQPREDQEQEIDDHDADRQGIPQRCHSLRGVVQKNRGIRHLDELCAQKVTLLQDYADDLAAQGKSAATIHKYMSGACRVFGVELGSITKPQRSVADVTRSRGRKPVDERADAQREASPRLYDFAERVGIRRAEYAALHGSDFGEDEVGPYVLVRRGKGGKRQKQRLLPSDADFVRAYFDGSEARF